MKENGKYENKKDRLAIITSGFEARGLTAVANYLTTKARKSRRTAITFSYGLHHLNKFIERKYNGKYNIQTILPLLKLEGSRKKDKRQDVYELFNGFVSYLQTETKNSHDLSPSSLTTYMNAARSYFQYNDIEISPSKFKNKVSLPPLYHQDEEAIDANDIKEILHHCDNRRLKAYLLVLASGGMRAIEALAIRECDIDFSGIDFNDVNDRTEPAGIKIRKEYSKTRTERHIFISNEAARYLHDWIEWKYRNKPRDKDDLIFSRVMYKDTGKYPGGLYQKILFEFHRVLQLAGFRSRKEDGVYKRRTVTFHSFRRFVKTTIANQTRNSDYSEWFLGHRKSTYYTKKPDELKRIYKEDCMKYLTFLDYPTLEATGRSFEAQLKQKENRIAQLEEQIIELQQKDNADKTDLSDQIVKLMKRVEELEKTKSKSK
jgi:integrase